MNREKIAFGKFSWIRPSNSPHPTLDRGAADAKLGRDGARPENRNPQVRALLANVPRLFDGMEKRGLRSIREWAGMVVRQWRSARLRKSRSAAGRTGERMGRWPKPMRPRHGIFGVEGEQFEGATGGSAVRVGDDTRNSRRSGGAR
jgi:hypothetical protein